MRKSITILLSMILLASCNKTQNAETAKTDEAIPKTESSFFPVGVINTDSILENYEFAVEARKRLAKKVDDATMSLSIKEQQLQKEMADFQKKYENHAFLSQERAEQEYNQLQQKGQAYEEHRAKLSKECDEETKKLSKQLKDSIDLAISILNKDKKFALIITTSAVSDNVLYTAPENDITNQVLKFLSKNR